jgi:metal-sulfur cluster biosynthetic enzyme
VNETEIKRLALIDALHDVMDPETGINLVDLGLIYEVAFAPEDGIATVVMTLTTPACPAGDVMFDGVQRRLGQVPGVNHVDVQLTFEPRWTPERITEDGKAQLGW